MCHITDNVYMLCTLSKGILLHTSWIMYKGILLYPRVHVSCYTEDEQDTLGVFESPFLTTLELTRHENGGIERQ
jgi:hypothetical protein